MVGVPSTIDNDLYGTDVSIGADTAVNITLEAIDRLRTTASSHQRAFAVETMGRDCGYIALMAGIAGGAEVIAIPESEITPAVRRRAHAPRPTGAARRTRWWSSPRARSAASSELMQHYEANKRRRSASTLRVTRLGHVVRGGAPSAADRVLATRLGAAAVDTPGRRQARRAGRDRAQRGDGHAARGNRRAHRVRSTPRCWNWRGPWR